MKKIYTSRQILQQQSHLWSGVLLENELSNCPDWNTLHYFHKYLPKDKLILEAGCGLGTWLVYLKDEGYTIEGVDHDGAVISRLKEMRPDVVVSQADISRLPYEDSALAAYISLGVLEHFEEGLDRPLLEAKRVLIPGGTMILTVPYNNLFRRLVAHPLRELYLLAHRLHRGEKHFAEYRYSKTEVHRIVKQAGFEILATDINDFVCRTRSLVFWSEFPFLRDKKEYYSLNLAGKMAAYVLNSLSPDILAAGILVVARKPHSLDFRADTARQSA